MMGSHTYTPCIISWNLTRKCNLKCAHCYLDSTSLDNPDDITAKEGMEFVDSISSLSPGAMLILTGGEPLLRPDFFEIASYASRKGLYVTVGTNGTLIDDEVARRLRESGVKGAGISIDSALPAFHDSFRGVDGAWEGALSGIRALKREGVEFQTQFTATRENSGDLEDVIALSLREGAKAVNVFFLVCTGRGSGMTDLSAQEYESALRRIARAEKELRGRIIVRARCAPHLLRISKEEDEGSPLLKGMTAGCIAAKYYMRITPEGLVTPCPYIPAKEGTPGLKDKTLREIWEEGADFVELRRGGLRGRCGVCEHRELCGGCRARSLSINSDLLGEDPLCSYEPKRVESTSANPPTSPGPVWTPQAKERLERVPSFLRGMVKSGLERYAVMKGICEITPELMSELKGKVNGQRNG